MVYLLLAIILTGLFVCIQIQLVLLHKHTKFTGTFCKIATSDSCKEVMDSPFSKVSHRIHIADVGTMYYSTLSIYVLFVSLFDPLYKIVIPLVLLTLFAFFFTLIGTVYQKFILKRWCRLCVLLYVVVWVQTGVIIYCLYALIDKKYQPSAFDFFTNSDFYPNIMALLYALGLSFCWLIVKPSIVNRSKNSFLFKQIVKAKKDVDLFIANLQIQKRVTEFKGENDYVLGNSNSSVQLILVLSPFCKACRTEYGVIASLLKSNPDKLSLRIRFVVDIENNKVKEAVSLIYSRYLVMNERDKADLLLHWFIGSKGFPILDASSRAELTSDNRVVDFVQSNSKWFRENGIERTPTLYVQGYKKPDFYTTHDIINFCKLNIEDPAIFQKIRSDL